MSRLFEFVFYLGVGGSFLIQSWCAASIATGTARERLMPGVRRDTTDIVVASWMALVFAFIGGAIVGHGFGWW